MKNAIVVGAWMASLMACWGCRQVQAQALMDEQVWPQGLFARAQQVDLANMPGSWYQHPGLNGTLYPFREGVGGMPVGAGHRYDSAIDYVSPTLHGLSVRAIYRFSEAPFSNAANRSYGATLGYARGPVTLNLSQQRKKDLIEAAGSVPAVGNAARDTMVAANVHFGAASAYAALGQHKGGNSMSWNDTSPYGAMLLSSPSTDSRDMLVGLSFAYGATVLMVSHGRRNDHNAANLDLTRFAIGVTHRWSRQTDFYAVYAKISNTSTPDQAIESGRGGAFNIGLRFGF
jgi:predicted porin